MIVKNSTGFRAITCLVFLLLAGGCGNVPDGASGKPRVAALLMQEDQFFRLCEAGMKAAATQYGLELSTMNSFGAVDKEADLVDASVARQVDALVVAPLSVKSSVPALERAHRKGIPVITYDGYVDKDIFQSSIRSDQVSLGRTTGQHAREYIAQHLDGKAKIALIAYMALAPETCSMRVQGFREEIAKLPGAEVVAEQDAWLAPQATTVAESLLTAHPDIDLIWAANEGGTVGAVKAVLNMGKAAKVKVFGTDISEQLADALLSPDDVLQAVTGQKGYAIGFTAVENAAKVLQGETVPKEVALPGVLFSRDNPTEVEEYRDLLRELSR
ncbi:MAG: substrate-binding domain-containing protein [Nitrospiraceae bacterium]|nr:substrate-binding domain-containing protein [Nitrospiraceae bacterium]